MKNPLTNSKRAALTVCLSGLYLITCFISIFRIVGSKNFITLSAMLAPAMGALFGPFIGVLSTIIGGLLGLFMGVLSPPSLISGIIASLFAGLLQNGRKILCIFFYTALLLFFGFYPYVGPVWLFPPLMWFQIFSLLIFIWFAWHGDKLNIVASYFTVSLVSTLAGQIAGSIAFEIIYWPALLPDLGAWKTIWQITTFLYPIERITIALGSTIIGVAVHKALRAAGISAHLMAC